MYEAITLIEARKSDLITVLKAATPPLFNDSRKAGEWNPQFSHYSQHHEQWEGFVFGVIVSSLADWVPVRNDSECLTLMREDHYGHERSWQIKNLEFIGGFACLGDIRRLYQTGKSKAA